MKHGKKGQWYISDYWGYLYLVVFILLGVILLFVIIDNPVKEEVGQESKVSVREKFASVIMDLPLTIEGEEMEFSEALSRRLDRKKPDELRKAVDDALNNGFWQSSNELRRYNGFPCSLVIAYDYKPKLRLSVLEDSKCPQGSVKPYFEKTYLLPVKGEKGGVTRKVSLGFHYLE